MEVAVSLPKYLQILSGLLPAGAVGASLMLAAAAPAAAHEEPTAATAKPRVSERLAAIRDAVSEVANAQISVRPGEHEPMLAWWNGGFFFRPWGNWDNWGNGWQNWSNWRNFWHNW